MSALNLGHNPPLDLARRECANMDADGRCWRLEPAELFDYRLATGAHRCPGCGTPMGCVDTLCPDCDPTVYHEGGDTRCLLAQGKRCGYFERAVLPLAKRADREDAKRARRAYEAAHGVLGGGPDEERSCPDCGAPIPKGRRYCDSCRVKRLKAANRRAQQRHRAGVRS